MGAAPDFLVEALQHVGRFEMLMVLERQAIEGQRLFDILLDPGDELWVAGAPFGDPGGEVAAGLVDRAPVVEPAQLLQAVVIGLAWQVVEGVAEEVDVTTLEGGVPDRTSRMAERRPAIRSSATTNSTPLRPRLRKPMRKSFQDERWLSRLAISTARIRRRPSQSMPMAISTAWLITPPPSRTFS